MIKYKNFLRFVFGIALLAHFSVCDNPTENMNTVWDPPSDWYLFPTWSPTGEWIAYEYSGPDGPHGIWLIRPDGSENHFETKGILADFSPDGKKLALVRGEKIFVYDLETKEQTQLTFEGSKSFPDWSPDGAKIAYYDLLGQPPLLIMDANGENKKPLVPLEYNHGANPKWFPDYRILFIRGTKRENISVVDLYVADTIGQNVIQLTKSGKINWNARVSSNGRRIVWERLGVKKNHEVNIWQMNADGSDKEWLTDGFEPDWAPDNRHIIFRKRGEYVGGEPYDDDNPKVHGSVWMMDVDTHAQWQFLPKN